MELDMSELRFGSGVGSEKNGVEKAAAIIQQFDDELSVFAIIWSELSHNECLLGTTQAKHAGSRMKQLIRHVGDVGRFWPQAQKNGLRECLHSHQRQTDNERMYLLLAFDMFNGLATRSLNRTRGQCIHQTRPLRLQT